MLRSRCLSGAVEIERSDLYDAVYQESIERRSGKSSYSSRHHDDLATGCLVLARLWRAMADQARDLLARVSEDA